MPVELPGIRSENEFYSEYYLSAIFDSDLAAWRTALAGQAERQPHERLRSLAANYNKMYGEWERTRRPEIRLNLQRDFLNSLLGVLGYDTQQVELIALENGLALPLFSEVRRPDGAPYLWIAECFDSRDEDADLLDLAPHPAQWGENGDPDETETFADLAAVIFAQPEPPRWLILAGHSQLVLLDRSKWGAKRLLRFSLADLYSQKDTASFQAMAAFLSRSSLCPDEGETLLDIWDENSHRHAFAVTEDLKYSLREAIELLGNAAIASLRQSHVKIYERDLADALSRECLRFMYRILFLLYVEARPELGYVPVASTAYRTGYSLDSLRNLEMTPLTTEEARNGSYFHDTLKRLFAMIWEGFPRRSGQELHSHGINTDYGFMIAPLAAHLFDPARTKLLNGVKIPNHVMQKIINLLSLSRETRGNQQRGRISYAQLGINQLGAVYESLLSYRGFFAEADLYEVKKAGTTPTDLETAYFVTEDKLHLYSDNERVFEANGTKLKKHPKGSFIYRMAGRDRQTSASYYTPEALTKCLVKYALKELLAGKTADEILTLTVCEPAMGSAAFLNEAVNQLAEAYLEAKERELGQIIPHGERAQELQKVKMYIADRNVYGVDLNPVAVELAEVSLWLNTIYQGAHVPWFGRQLHTGNSLVGARRQVYTAALLKPENRTAPFWLDAVPERVMPGSERPPEMVYHFLVPADGMANYTDRVIKDMAPDAIRAIREWQRAMNKPFNKEQVTSLLRLSAKVDELWQTHIEQMKEVARRTTDTMNVFGHPETMVTPLSNQMKDKIYQEEILSENIRCSSPYRRLKLVMDYWCALWFWPIDAADDLPSRDEWLLDLSLILEGNVYEDEAAGEMTLFPETMPEAQAMSLFRQHGGVNLTRLVETFPRLHRVAALAERYRFFHWELEFADVFAERGGFDLVLGNPPWIKVEWEEGTVLGDADPLQVIRSMSATEQARRRQETLREYGLRDMYFSAYESAAGLKNFLNSSSNYPLLAGVQTNLYKCFLPQAWMVTNARGVSGFVHPEGVYDDARGGELRAAIYPRLCYHFGFYNELLLFADIDHHNQYSLNVYRNGREQDDVSFTHMANLYTPKTIDEAFSHDGRGPTPGIKTEEGKWNTKGHRRRLLSIGRRELELFASLYDEEGTLALQARMPGLHSREQLDVLRKLSCTERIRAHDESMFSTVMFDETYASQDGTICRETRFPDSPGEWILNGPHIYVATPLFKTPRSRCALNGDYDPLDLTTVPSDYLPRSNYVPACSPEEYARRTPKVNWDGSLVTRYYRLAFRKMLAQSGARTLISAILPPEPAHIHGIISCAFEKQDLLLSSTAVSTSLLGDFYIKTTGQANLNVSWQNLPYLNPPSAMKARVLALNCLTTHYSELWRDCWQDEFRAQRWTKSDSRLDNSFFTNLAPDWHRDCALRTDYARRQALVELDVLVAQAVGLTVDELCTIYRLQFPVLYGYEADTWYDRNGRIVFTTNKGLPGVGLDRSTWETVKEKTTGTVTKPIIDDTQPGGPIERVITYVAPFDRCDRETDYRLAWAEFERRGEENKR